MSEFYPKSVYGGSMSAEEFIKAEFEIDKELPKWKAEKERSFFIVTTKRDEVYCDYKTTDIVMFDEPYEVFNYLFVTREGKEPAYLFFPEEGRHTQQILDDWDAMLEDMLDEGFRTHTVGEPDEKNFNMRWGSMRGMDKIENVIKGILDGKAE